MRDVPDPTEFQLLAEAMPEIMWTARPDGAISFVNHKWTEYTGLSVEESLGWGWTRAVHPDDVYDTSAIWRRGLSSDEPFEVEYRLRDRSGAYRWFTSRAVPQRHRKAGVVQWVGNSFDIDRHRRALDALSLLADTGSVLGASLDLQSMLDMLLPVLVPRLCDWAVVSLFVGGTLRIASIMHRDAKKDALAASLVGRPHYSFPDAALSPTYAALATGKPQIWNKNDASSLEEVMRPETREIVHELGQQSAVVAPLRDDGNVIGTLGAVRGSNGEAFKESDIPLLQEVADRAAVAKCRARVFEREPQIADTLQVASLPTTLPEVAGFEFDAFYSPALNESKVGGDWYDVFPVSDGRIALTVGDVSGHGLHASIAMGKIRNTIRALTFNETDPASLLRAADAMMRRDSPDVIATALVGFLNTSTCTLALSTAGHPPPLLRLADGKIIELPTDGLPLPLLTREHPPVAATVALPQGSLLLFYTDGLIEDTRDIIEGERILREVLASEEIVDAASPARFIHDRILAVGGQDDVAILTLKVVKAPEVPPDRRGIPEALQPPVVPPAWAARWRFEVLDYGAPSNAREAFLRFLQTRGEPDADYAAAELIFGELVSNVVRHAAPPLQIELDWTGEYPVLHMQDQGNGFEWHGAHLPEPTAEGGRGLYLCSLLARDLQITRIPHYGAHVRVTLDVPRRK